MSYSGNSVCGMYGSTPWDDRPEEHGRGRTFNREMMAEFNIRGVYSPYKNTVFAVDVTFDLERDGWGDWSHTIRRIVGYDANGDENTGLLIIAGISEHEINTAIEREYYDDGLLDD